MIAQRPTFVIAEAGVNHNGDEKTALALVAAAVAAKADAVKFQTFRADQLVRRGAPKAEYQHRGTDQGDQHAMLKALELDEAAHERLAGACAAQGIEFMSTAFDEDSLALLVRLGIRRIKVPSGELTNLPLLRAMAGYDLPIIVSTGMADMAEIAEAIATIAETRRARGFASDLADIVTVLHCTSSYPTAPEDVNLRAMTTMAEALALPVGYSDHTLGPTVALAAVALGAGVIEKHLTLDRAMPGPDHAASMEPADFADLVRRIRVIETALGDGIKRPTAGEYAIRDVARRSVTLVADKKAGEALQADDLALLRPGDGVPPRAIAEVVGRVLVRDLESGTTLQWSDLGSRSGERSSI